jgi:hypothetical protein
MNTEHEQKTSEKKMPLFCFVENDQNNGLMLIQKVKRRSSRILQKRENK